MTAPMLLSRRRHVLAAGAAALAAGCSVTGGAKPRFASPPSLVPLDVSAGRLMKITVCTRPFRATGPRLEAETIAGRRIVHNYGHGGSGWSLSWGCAAEAAALALPGGGREIAVIGAGVIGMTTAIRLVEAGADVTIYAKEFPAETRSARATGVWSPSSRIALAGDVAAGFEDRWEGWARAGFLRHLEYIGASTAPVEFLQQYSLFDEENGASSPASHDFLHLDRRLQGLVPNWGAIDVASLPFPVARVRGGQTLSFNVAGYSELLTRDFLLRGGRMIRRDFADRAAILALREKVIVNCTGYGAKALWSDASLTPVRGQINWLTPQLTARYGLFYRGVSVVSRRDGVVVQQVGPNEDLGFGVEDETPDRAEMESALATIAPLFA